MKEVKTISFTKSWGSFYSDEGFRTKKMDVRVAEMLAEGWTLLNSADHSQSHASLGAVALFGVWGLLARSNTQKITLTFQR
jgi:hypothetical protein